MKDAYGFYGKSPSVREIGEKSYGILCVTANFPYYVVLTCSPSYATLDILKNKKRKINSSECYNLFLASFPGTSGEGQYSLPRGKIDKIDNNSVINTKIREFMEETKCMHPQLKLLANEHYTRDKNGLAICSIFTDKDCIVEEKWIGLDNRIYSAEYTIFVIDGLEDLTRLCDESINMICSDDILEGDLLPFTQALTRRKERYKRSHFYNSRVDRMKRTIVMPLVDVMDHLNAHRLHSYVCIDKIKIYHAIAKYKK